VLIRLFATIRRALAPQACNIGRGPPRFDYFVPPPQTVHVAFMSQRPLFVTRGNMEEESMSKKKKKSKSKWPEAHKLAWASYQELRTF